MKKGQVVVIPKDLISGLIKGKDKYLTVVFHGNGQISCVGSYITKYEAFSFARDYRRKYIYKQKGENKV